jgi:predicted amidohydrolase
MSPGELFAHLWAKVEPHASDVILRPWLGRNAAECTHLAGLFRTCDGIDIPADVESYLNDRPVSFETDIQGEYGLERAFVVMCALDDAAMDIHPCSKTRIAGRNVALSNLQAEMKSVRTTEARYGYIPGVGSVIAKGQLTPRRIENEAEEANGANLDSQFEYMTVVANPKSYTVSFMVIPPYRFGMADAMTQKLGIAPIAEDAEDLTFTASSRSGRGYLDARPSNPAALGARMTEVVATLLDQGAGIVALPELVSSSEAIDALQKHLRSRSTGGHSAILVCGSGLSKAPCPKTGRYFNEATIMTSKGKVLFRQQKIHPFNMASDRMTECQVAQDPSHVGKPHMEDIAASSTLTVCDVPDIGRIIVMICEDFEQAAPTGALALSTRPDWIFAPVLDVSLEIGRWTHQRCMEIGRRTLSRIVVTSSATLSVRAQRKSALAEANINAVGIGILYDGYNRRHVKRVKPDLARSPQAIFLDWNSDVWDRDHVRTRPSS